MGVLSSHSSGLKRTWAVLKELKHTIEIWHGTFCLPNFSLIFTLWCLGMPMVHVHTHKHKCNYCAGIAQQRLLQSFLSLLSRRKWLRRTGPHAELGDLTFTSLCSKELSGSFRNCYLKMPEIKQGFVSVLGHLAQGAQFSQRLLFP